MVQPVHGAVSPSGTLLIGQILDMRWILDLLVAIVAARMGGDDGTGVQDTHGIGVARTSSVRHTWVCGTE